jgi:hypothetical protein
MILETLRAEAQVQFILRQRMHYLKKNCVVIREKQMWNLPSC